MNLRLVSMGLVMMTVLVPMSGCAENEPNDLDTLAKVRMKIGTGSYELWVADKEPETSRGLMLVTEEQMKPLPDGTRRGMLFVFDHERYLSFWMRNTIIPLDIAYINANGQVVATYTMRPLDERPNAYPSEEPAQFAIEMNAGDLEKVGLEKGDTVEIPESVLNVP